MKKKTKTELAFCKSYYDNNNELKDCTCGKCEEVCKCGNPKMDESDFCKDCL